MAQSKPHAILFVCLGNICRSPMAEAVFRHQVKLRGLSERFQIDSAGTGGWHQGEPPHHGTQQVLQKHAISFSGQTARKLVLADFDIFDLIVAMDRDNQRDILSVAPKSKKTLPAVNLLLSYAGMDADIPDPYYTGKFDLVFELVSKGCFGLLDHMLLLGQ